MKQWVGLGKFLAGHMQVIVPICVALGVLFPQQIGVLKPIVPALFAFMTFQGALSNTFHQVAEMFRRPLHSDFGAARLGGAYSHSGLCHELTVLWFQPQPCLRHCARAQRTRGSHCLYVD